MNPSLLNIVLGISGGGAVAAVLRDVGGSFVGVAGAVQTLMAAYTAQEAAEGGLIAAHAAAVAATEGLGAASEALTTALIAGATAEELMQLREEAAAAGASALAAAKGEEAAAALVAAAAEDVASDGLAIVAQVATAVVVAVAMVTVAILATGAGATRAAAAYETLDTRLRAVFQSARQGDEAFAWVRNLALNGAGAVASIGDLTDDVIKLRALGLDAGKILPALIATAAATGGGQSSIERQALALGRISQLGYIDLRAVRVMLSSLVPAGDIIRAAGLVEGSMKDLGKSAVSTAEFIDLVTKAEMRMYGESVANLMKTAAGQVRLLGVEWQDFLARLGQAVVPAVLPILQSVRALLMDTAFQEGATRWAQRIVADMEYAGQSVKLLYLDFKTLWDFTHGRAAQGAEDWKAMMKATGESRTYDAIFKAVGASMAPGLAAMFKNYAAAPPVPGAAPVGQPSATATTDAARILGNAGERAQRAFRGLPMDTGTAAGRGGQHSYPPIRVESSDHSPLGIAMRNLAQQAANAALERAFSHPATRAALRGQPAY